ncbi:MAG: hypothetical protein WCP33_03465 [Deltaproteobacteria bacterium]
MTVETNVSKAHFLGSGSVGPFTFDFRFFLNSEVYVIKTSSTGIDTDLTETVHYTLIGAGSTSGGSVTLITALATEEELTIYRVVQPVQTTSIRNQAAFFPEIHENVFDKLVMMVQQITDVVKRSFKMPVTSTADFEFPKEAYADKLLAFGTDGNPEFRDSGYSVTVLQGAAGTVSPSYHTADSGNVTVNLPASGEVIVVKTGNTSRTVNLIPAGASTIMGLSSYSLYLQGESIHLVFDGTSNWCEI